MGSYWQSIPLVRRNQQQFAPRDILLGADSVSGGDWAAIANVLNSKMGQILPDSSHFKYAQIRVMSVGGAFSVGNRHL
jgi:hypothetical protein